MSLVAYKRVIFSMNDSHHIWMRRVRNRSWFIRKIAKYIPQKSPVHSRHIWMRRIRNRYLYVRSKKINVYSAKDPSTSAKDPFVFAEEPCFHVTYEWDAYAIDLYLFEKEPCIFRKRALYTHITHGWDAYAIDLCMFEKESCIFRKRALYTHVTWMRRITYKWFMSHLDESC